jgi:hypothetical protein
MALVEPVPFPFEIDWSERFTEEREYETAIQELWDHTEQRSALTDVPNRRFSYLIKCLEVEHDELQRVQAAVRGGQHLQWWVPYWPRARFITGAVVAGAVGIPVASSVSMAIVAGQGLLLYRSPARFEVVEVTAVNPTNVEVTATTLEWRARDKVIPCFRGYLAPEADFINHDVDLGSVRVTFDLEITD